MSRDPRKWCDLRSDASMLHFFYSECRERKQVLLLEISSMYVLLKLLCSPAKGQKLIFVLPFISLLSRLKDNPSLPLFNSSENMQSSCCQSLARKMPNQKIEAFRCHVISQLSSPTKLKASKPGQQQHDLRTPQQFMMHCSVKAKIRKMR